MFAFASMIHSGWLIPGYEHARARVAEPIIALVLLSAWSFSWFRPHQVRRVGIAAQGFALLGTLVGLFTVAVGIGPRTTADLVFHLGLIVILTWGLRVARASAEPG
jgi:hypothetical protein